MTVSRDDDDACGVGKRGDRCSSTAAQRSNKCGNMDSPRNSRNNFVDNIHSTLGNRNSRPRLRPERQLVLPEAEPAQLLLMEVKEVFS